MKFRNLNRLLFFLFICGTTAQLYAQTQVSNSYSTQKDSVMTKKMKIEIWSDVACPFCFIGKHKFENALAQFPDRKNIEVVWKNFLLNPQLKTDTTVNIADYLSREKGIPLQQIKSMNQHIESVGKSIGIEINTNGIIVANTFLAHNLIQFAKQYGKDIEAEELLFVAYFSHNKNVDELSTLMEIGEKLALDTEKLKAALLDKKFGTQVMQDVDEARQLGIRGVPFFLFNRKYAISGAQETQVFLNTIQKAYAEWLKENPQPVFETIEGQNCTIEGECN